MSILYPDDIDENILAALKLVFKQELMDAMNAVGDTLALKTLKQADLQDDPTLVAPYLVYRPDIEKGVIQMPKEKYAEYGGREIGGPIRFLHHFDAKFGTPVQTTRELARRDIAIIATRVQQTLIKFFDLAGVLSDDLLRSPDQSKVIESANPYLVDDTKTRIFGGETEFYGEGHCYWHYPVSWYQPYRVFNNQ